MIDGPHDFGGRGAVALAPFEGAAYRVVGVGHEKVLFGHADVQASSASASASATTAAAAVQVPFDVQLWLRLAPRN